MIRMHLTDAQRRELEAASRRATGRVALRAQMVLLAGRDYTVRQIAAIHACGCDVVRLWLQRYAQEGIAGLQDRPRGGRPPKDRLAGPIVDAQASQSPRCSGHVQSSWSAARLAAFLARRFRVALSCATVRRYLHRMGWRWARPRLAPARKADPEGETKRAALAHARLAAAQGRAHLLYLDESDLHLLPLVRAMWMKGRRLRVPTPGTNARHAFFGALDAASGHWLWADHERKFAVHFVAFLERIVAAYPTGSLYLALDNAPTHTAKVVARWFTAHPHVSAVWLPKYAAHQENPAERIWGLMKDAVAADRLEGTIQDLAAVARRFFTELAPHPVKLPLAA
jgi:transposase